MRLANPNVLHPILQFRYTILSAELSGAAIYARSAQQPSFDNNPIRAHYGNTYFDVKGKTSWNPISLKCYQFEGVTLPQFWVYVRQHQEVKFGWDKYARDYKHTMRLTLLSPDGIVPVGTWKLFGAFFKSVTFGDMDWGGEEVAEVDAQINYDWAEYSLII